MSQLWTWAFKDNDSSLYLSYYVSSEFSLADIAFQLVGPDVPVYSMRSNPDSRDAAIADSLVIRSSTVYLLMSWAHQGPI